MHRPLRLRFFVHSLVSDWDNGKAHFLRGLMRALTRMGHEVRSYEELGCAPLRNLMHHEKERSIDAIDGFRAAYPELDIHFYRGDSSFAEFAAEELANVDAVIVLESNEPSIVNQVLALKSRFGFKAIFYDTHHLACRNVGHLLRFQLHLFDGILVFGDAVRQIYLNGLGVECAWTLHEAADVEIFYPRTARRKADAVWIGNWGGEEHGRVLEEFLVEPALVAGYSVAAYGVQYPATVIQRFVEANIGFRGYLPNLMVPETYAQSPLALHIPGQRDTTDAVAAAPVSTRVFEALACGATLVSAPWQDAEGLFEPGEDYVVVQSGREMCERIKDLLADDHARRQIGENGLAKMRARHTCVHRAEQFTEILEQLHA